MRIVRFQRAGVATWGFHSGAEVQALAGSPLLATPQPVGPPIPISDVKLLAPIEPRKVIGVGRNYVDHAGELGLDLPTRPRIFLKPSSAVIGPGEAIRCPAVSADVQHEAELAVIIGRPCSGVGVDEALSFVAGVTCANDVTARDIQREDGQPTYAKSFDTFCPLGPAMQTDFDLSDLTISCSVNGEIRQKARATLMIWPVPDLISYIATAMTLDVGDVILTGTPAGVSRIVPGDTVTVSIDGVGDLTNPVVAA